MPVLAQPPGTACCTAKSAHATTIPWAESPSATFPSASTSLVTIFRGNHPCSFSLALTRYILHHKYVPTWYYWYLLEEHLHLHCFLTTFINYSLALKLIVIVDNAYAVQHSSSFSHRLDLFKAYGDVWVWTEVNVSVLCIHILAKHIHTYIIMWQLLGTNLNG